MDPTYIRKHQRNSIEIKLLHEIKQLTLRNKFETHKTAMQQCQEDLHHQIQQLEKHIEQLTSLHQEENYIYSQRINELGNIIQQLENARSSLVQELQNAQTVCSNLEADNSSLKQRLGEATQQLSTSKLEIRKLQNRLEEVTRQQRGITNCLEKTREEVIGLTNVKHEQLQVIQNLKQENEFLASQVSESIEWMSTDGAEKQQNEKLTEKVNESNDDTLDINSLPDELLLEMFGYLKHNQLGQIARVCRRWNVLTRSPVLWKKVTVNISPSFRCPTTITISFINTLPSCVTSIRLDFIYDWTERLDFEKLCMRLQEKCPRLEELILTKITCSDSFSSVMYLCSEYLQDVKKLVFCHAMFSDCLTHECSAISKIEILVLIDCISNYQRPLNKPNFSRMPYLKELHLCSDTRDSWFVDDASFLNQLHVLNLGYTFITPVTFRAIQNHGHNLKELCLCLVNLQDHDLNINHSVFPQLKTICRTDCQYVTCEGVVSLLQSCQSLQSVYVDEDIAESFEAHPFVVANRCKSGIVKGIDCNHFSEFYNAFRI